MLRGVGVAACSLPLLFGGWVMHTSRGVIVTDPILHSPFGFALTEETKRGGPSCLLCAFATHCTAPSVAARQGITQHPEMAAMWAIHALCQSRWMRMEFMVSAFTARWRVSDVWMCWQSIRPNALRAVREVDMTPQTSRTQMETLWGVWEVLPLEKGNAEAVLRGDWESMGVSLCADEGEVGREVVFRLCYAVRPFDRFEKGSFGEQIALWGATWYGKVITAQAARAVERL